MRSWTRGCVFALVLGLVLGACGSFDPLATPFRRRPPLPGGDPFPAPMVEDAVATFIRRGFDCRFQPESDVAEYWICERRDEELGSSIDIDLDGSETGPIRHASGSYNIKGAEKDDLDRHAAGIFLAEILDPLVPADVRPSEAELIEMINANWPARIGEGWLLGFDRNSGRRSIRIVYSLADVPE